MDHDCHYDAVKFFEWIANISAIATILLYTLAMLIFCGVGVFCSWEVLFR